MELGALIQIVQHGQVLSTSGVLRPVKNSFVYALLAPWTVIPPKNLWSLAWGPLVWTPILALLPTEYRNVETTVLYPNTPGDTPLSIAEIGGGTLAGGRLPLNQCVFANLKTPSRGRYYTGSKRLGPVSPSHVQGDELTPAAQAAWQAAAANFTSPLMIHFGFLFMTAFPVVWSRLLSASDTFIPPGIGDQLSTVHVNRTLGQWKHRRERVVR